MSESLDRRIEEEIRYRLRQAYLVGAENIEVAVAGGVVELRGACEQWELARMVRTIASHIPGVERVDIDLEVRLHAGGASRLHESVEVEEVDEGSFESLAPPLPPSAFST